MISRVKLCDVFFGVGREGVVKFSRRGVAVFLWGTEGAETAVAVGVSAPVDRSGVSEAVESLGDVWGFNGVRKGDLNGLRSVFEASFNRRRLACGDDIVLSIHPLVVL